MDGAVLGSNAFVLRYFGRNADRLLVINLGWDQDLLTVPEPLLAPPADLRWGLLWSSESVEYGGQGTPPIHPNAQWHLPGESALLFASEDEHDDKSER